MANIANLTTDDIKEFMMHLLLGISDRKKRATLLCALSDFSGISKDSDWKTTSEFTATVIFVRASEGLLDEEKYDEWIEMFKQRLLRLENYELIHELHL